MVANLSIPILRTHSPYIERKDVRVHVRAGFIALLTAGLLTLAVGLAWTILPQAAADTQARVIQWSTAKPSTSGWQYPRETPSYEFMYAPGAETRNVGFMYAKPRPRNLGR